MMGYDFGLAIRSGQRDIDLPVEPMKFEPFIQST
jgi:hypothetical protein